MGGGIRTPPPPTVDSPESMRGGVRTLRPPPIELPESLIGEGRLRISPPNQGTAGPYPLGRAAVLAWCCVSFGACRSRSSIPAPILWRPTY
eukprot:610068-Pyramimonas_sp.AAC.1